MAEKQNRDSSPSNGRAKHNPPPSGNGDAPRPHGENGGTGPPGAESQDVLAPAERQKIISSAMLGFGPGKIDEEDLEKVLAWATRVRADQTLLDLVLAAHLVPVGFQGADEVGFRRAEETLDAAEIAALHEMFDRIERHYVEHGDDDDEYDEDEYDDLDERDLRHYLDFNERDQGCGEPVSHRVATGNVDLVVQATGVLDAIKKALELVERPGGGDGTVCLGLVIMVKPQDDNAVFRRSVDAFRMLGRRS
jgi:hypothetical protein